MAFDQRWKLCGYDSYSCEIVLLLGVDWGSNFEVSICFLLMYLATGRVQSNWRLMSCAGILEGEGESALVMCVV